MTAAFNKASGRSAGCIAAALLACSLFLCGCRSAPEPTFDWPARTGEAGGWNFIRKPWLDRSIWFCIRPDECSWQRLGVIAGLDPAEHQWWAQDMEGDRALEAKPMLGKRYTLPNKVYIAMGDASFYNPLTEVPYLGYAYQWLIDYPQSAWSPATRPIGAAVVFRPGRPLDEGYNVTTIQNLSISRLGEIIRSADTYGMVYHGHGNGHGLGTYNLVHGELASVISMREAQHHLFGRSVLNSCVSRRSAEQLTSPTGLARGHQDKYMPPLGIIHW